MKQINKLIAIVLICVMAQAKLMAQVQDTTFTSTLRGQVLTFRYKQVLGTNTKDALQVLAKSPTPYYILTQKDLDFWINNTKNSHLAITAMDSAIQGLKVTNTLDNQIKVQLENVIAQTNGRVELYKNAYQESLRINESYSTQLGNCIELNKKKPGPRKVETFVWGAVSGLVIGLITAGTLIAR